METPFIEVTGFSNLISAHDWICHYIGNTSSRVLTNESFINGVYRFSVPPKTELGEPGFCSVPNVEEHIRFIDAFGLISNYGDNSFNGNIQDNEFSTKANLSELTEFSTSFVGATGNNTFMGEYNFSANCFKDASPKFRNFINKIIYCSAGFANNYSGRFDINQFGDTPNADLSTDLFTTNNLVWIYTRYPNKFVDSGSPDGDILNAVSNMTNANSAVFYK